MLYVCLFDFVVEILFKMNSDLCKYGEKEKIYIIVKINIFGC